MRRCSLRRTVLVCLATVASLLLVARPDPADATPTWLTPGHVLSGPTSEAADVQVAVAPGGHTLAVWRVQVGATFVLQMSERKPGGLWTVPAPLYSTPDLLFSIRAAVDDTGRAIVAWSTNSSSGKLRAWVTMRSSGTATWSTPDSMGGDPVNTSDPDVALGSNGEVLLAFRLLTSAGQQLAVVGSTNGKTWDGPAVSALVGFVGAPQVAVDATGAPTVAWHQSVGSGTFVYSRSRLADGSWSSAVTHAVGDANLADLVTSGRGEVVMLWRAFNGSTYRLFVRTLAASGAWGPATPVTGPGDFQSSPHLAVDAQGRGTVAFAGWNGSEYEARAISQQPNGAWPAFTVLSAPGQSATAPEVTVDGAGTVTTAWVAAQGGSATLQARSRPVGGGWRPTELLGAAHSSIYANGSIAADHSGNVVAGWEEAAAPHTVARLVVLDGAGPGLGSPTVTARAYASKATSLFVPQPVDTWSAVAPVSWSFGDGGTASGPTPMHTWTKPGSYPVTVSATDAVGNTTSTTAAVQVTGRPRLSKVRLSQTELQLRASRTDLAGLSFRLDTDARVMARLRLVSSGPAGRVVVKLVRKHLATGRHTLLLRTTMKGVHLPVGAYRITLVATNPAGKGRARSVRLAVAE